MKLAQKIPLLTKRKGISQSELARTLGIDPSRVSEWVNGKAYPSLAHAFRMARLFEVTLDYLADEVQDEPPAAEQDFWAKRIQDVVNELGPQRAYRRLIGISDDIKDSSWDAIGVDSGADPKPANKRGA